MKMKLAEISLLMPSLGSSVDNCYREITGGRHYRHISIDLINTGYDLNPKGAKRVGDFCTHYAGIWAAQSTEGLKLFPRNGIMYSPAPTTYVGMTVHKDDVEWAAKYLWRQITNKKHLVKLDLRNT